MSEEMEIIDLEHEDGTEQRHAITVGNGALLGALLCCRRGGRLSLGLDLLQVGEALRVDLGT